MGANVAHAQKFRETLEEAVPTLHLRVRGAA